MESICFIMPQSAGLKPSGGYKVVFEYAIRFAKKGYDVTIQCSAIMRSENKKLLQNINITLKFPLVKLYLKIFKINWFDLKNVKYRFCWEHTERSLAKYDHLIATAIQTSYLLNQFNKLKGKKYYFIQGFENWGGFTDDDVYNSYKFDMKKIVIAPWLADKVALTGEKTTIICNGFEFDRFRLTNKIENRNKLEIAMFYSDQECKRCTDSFMALNIVKKEYPSLHVTVFGIFKRPQFLPDWYDYYQAPSNELHNKIYNNAAIFIAASSSEGFGLTIGEAMICGCAVACTDNDGFKMMVKQNDTGLLSPIMQPNALAKNILKLINNDSLRVKLAKAGTDYISNFTWDKSVKKFLDVLQS